MDKINAIIEWVKDYRLWETKDYIKAGVVVIVVIGIIVSIA
jgi:hypothetical protein|tara:strand:+ start:276 stop:398 length:123 start_codon:yes stop_codon:yes gene_type:complete